MSLDAAIIERLQPIAPLECNEHHQCYCNSTHSGWIVAVTHPQAERWANTNLQQRGYKTYLPMALRRRRDRSLPTLVHNVLAPLWPGYLFVLHHSRDSWRPIYETPGVRSVIKNGSQLQYARKGAVEAVEAGEHSRRSLPPENARTAPGSAVRVGMGIFQGYPGVITEVDQQTARVSLMFLGCLREIALPLDCLTPRED